MTKLSVPRLPLLQRLPKLSRLQWMVVATIAILLLTLVLVVLGHRSLGLTFFLVAIAVMILWWLVDRSVLMLNRRREDAFDSDLEEQSKSDALRHDWKRAVEELRTTGIDRYSLSFYLLIGETAGGKTTTLLKSGLNFPIGTNLIRGYGGTRNCNWWFTDEAVILDTAGRYVFHQQEGDLPEEGKRNPAEWLTFLKLVKKYRPRCPINGVLVALPCDSLLTDDAAERERKADVVRSALVEIERTLEIRYPVYVLLTKADKIGGFVDFFSNLKATEQGQLLGWSRPPTARNQPFAVEELDEAFRDMATRFRSWRVRSLNDHVERDAIKAIDRMFSFPEEFMRLAPALKDYLAAMFPGGKLIDPLFLRGFYLTSGEQSGVPVLKTIEESLEGRSGGLQDEAPVEADEKRVFFIRDFYRKKVLQEPELIQPTRAFVRRVRWVRNAGFGAAGVLGLLGILFLGMSYFKIQKELNEPTSIILSGLDHVYSDADDNLDAVQTADKYTKRLPADFEPVESLDETLALLADLRDPQAATHDHSKPGDPKNLIARLDNSEILAPVWVFRLLDSQKEALHAGLWRAYHTIALKGIIVPIWDDILKSLGGTTIEDIAKPEDFRAFERAVIAFVRLTHRPLDADDVVDTLKELEFREFEDDEIEAALGETETVSSRDLLAWVTRRSVGVHALDDPVRFERVALALDVMWQVDDAMAADADLADIFGPQVSTEQTDTGDAVLNATKLIQERWQRAFCPLDAKDWVITDASGSEQLAAARVWWSAFGAAHHLCTTVPALGDLATKVASEAKNVKKLEDFRKAYASTWTELFSRAERADQQLLEFASRDRVRAAEDAVNLETAKDSLRRAWRRSFAQLLALSAGAQEIVSGKIQDAARATATDFEARAKELDEFGDHEGDPAGICEVKSDGTVVTVRESSPVVTLARSTLRPTSRLMRIAMDPSKDRALGGSAVGECFGDILFAGERLICPAKGELDKAFTSIASEPAGLGSDKNMEATWKLARRAANSSLLALLTDKDTWERLGNSLNESNKETLDIPAANGVDTPFKLDGRYKASAVMHLVRDYVNPVAAHIEKASGELMEYDGITVGRGYRERLDDCLNGHIREWNDTWAQLYEACNEAAARGRRQAGVALAATATESFTTDTEQTYRDMSTFLHDQRDKLTGIETILSGWRAVEPDELEVAVNLPSGPAFESAKNKLRAASVTLGSREADGSAERLDGAIKSFTKELDDYLDDKEQFNTGLGGTRRRKECNTACGAIPQMLVELRRSAGGPDTVLLAPVHAIVGDMALRVGARWSSRVSETMREEYQWLVEGDQLVEKGLDGSTGFPIFAQEWAGGRLTQTEVTKIFGKAGFIDFWSRYEDQLRPRHHDLRRVGFEGKPSWGAEGLPVVNVEMSDDLVSFLAFTHDLCCLVGNLSEQSVRPKLDITLRRVNYDSPGTKLSGTMDGQVTYVWLRIGDPSSKPISLTAPRAVNSSASGEVSVTAEASSPVSVGTYSNLPGDAIDDRFYVQRGNRTGLPVKSADFNEGTLPFLEFLLEYADPSTVRYQPIEGDTQRFESIVQLRLPIVDIGGKVDEDEPERVLKGKVQSGDVFIEMHIKMTDDAVFPNTGRMMVPPWRED